MVFRRLLVLSALVGAFIALGLALQSPSSSADGGPTITSVTPASGPKTGGTQVTLEGTGLTGTTDVTVGGQTGSDIQVIDDSTVTFITPAGTVGAQDVVVTSGEVPVTEGDGFTYVAVKPDAPTSLSGTARDTQVDLTWSAPAETGGAAIDGYRIESSTDGGETFSAEVDNTGSTSTSASVTGLTNGTTYVFRVAAINSVGTGTFSSNSSAVTPQDPPAITTVAPSSGTDLGGTEVTISGSDFTGATAVSVAGTAVASFTVDGPTQITATTDAGTAGTGDVVVTTPSGSATSSNAFQYLAIPTITNTNPFYGPLAGGTSVTITGTNFTGATEVLFGDSDATSYTVDSATQITAVAPAGSAGDVDVRVTTADGVVTESGGFTYFALPEISALSVESGPTTGSTSVILTGSNFTGTTAVTFGGINATSYTVNSASQITAETPTAPGGNAGAVDVRVVTPGGTATRADGFTFVSAGDPIEIVLRDKGTTQVQFHICHNLPNPTSLNLGMQIEFRIRSGSSIVVPTDVDWLQSLSPDVPYEPNNTYNETHVPPADLGVSSSDLVMRYRPNQNPNVTAISVPACGQNMAGVFPWFSNQTGSVGGVWEDGDGNALVNGPALTPGNTYILEATLLTTTRSAPITHTTYRKSLVTTMGGGCPIGAPVETLPVFPQMWAGLDGNNRVVAVADVYAENPWASYPSVVSTAYTYPTWPGKTFAQTGYYFDPRTNDFGPEAVLGDVIRGSEVVTQADMEACEAAGYTISMTVDSSSSSICSISDGAVVGSDEGACKVNVTATGPAPASFTGLMPRASASLTRSATFVVRESSGGGGSSPGGGGGAGSSGSSGASSSGGGGGGLNEIISITPAASGSPGSTIALGGWGLGTTRAVFFGDYPATSFSVVNDGQVTVVVPDIPDGIYPIHAQLAPEVGRATYWAGFSVNRSIVEKPAPETHSVVASEDSPGMSVLMNPVKSRKLGRGVVVVDRAAAQQAQSIILKRNMARKVKKAPKPTVQLGETVRVTVRGLPEDTQLRARIRIGKKYRTLGSATSNSQGQLTLPGISFDKRGNFRIRIKHEGIKYFITLRIRK